MPTGTLTAADHDLTLKKYDRDTYQIWRDGKVIALIDALANGGWQISVNGWAISEEIFRTPKMAFKAFPELEIKR
jgi:hypothetical protein